jgi:DNA-binding NarL/FixJ family response regulator
VLVHRHPPLCVTAIGIDTEQYGALRRRRNPENCGWDQRPVDLAPDPTLAGVAPGQEARMRDARTTIVIVDENEMTRRGLRALLHAQADLYVSAECGTAQEAVAHVVRIAPQVVVMDPALSDAGGFETCRRLREQRPGVRVVMLVGRVDERTVGAAVRAGATAVLSKRAPLPEICDAVRAAAAGVARLDGSATAALFEHVRGHSASRDGDDALTELERRVLAGVVAGRTNKQIGQALGIGEKTVKSQLSKAFAKLHVTRRTRAAVVFLADSRPADGFDAHHRTA